MRFLCVTIGLQACEKHIRSKHMKKQEYPAFRNYLYEYVTSLDETSEAQQIRRLQKELDKKLPAKDGKEHRVSERAIKKWVDGDAYPDTENLIALSEIFHCTVDDLLKDKKETIRFNDSLPEWYENLSEQSKKIVLATLEPYRTGNICFSAQDKLENSALDYFLEYSKDDISNATNTLVFPHIFNSLFFELLKEDNEIKIVDFDKYYTHDQIIKKEKNTHQKKYQQELLQLIINHENFSDKLIDAQRILRLIEIGYIELPSRLGYADFIDKTYIFQPLITGDSPVEMRPEDHLTTCANECGFTVETESIDSFLQTFNPHYTNSIKKDINKWQSRIEQEYFHELINCNKIKLSYTFAYIDFHTEKFNHSKPYFETRLQLLIDEREAKNILINEYKNEINTNATQLNKRFKHCLVHAHHIYTNIKQEKNNGNDT